MFVVRVDDEDAEKKQTFKTFEGLRSAREYFDQLNFAIYRGRCAHVTMFDVPGESDPLRAVAEAKKGHAQLLDQDHEEIEAQMRDRLTKKLNLNALGLLKKPQTPVTPIECPHCNDTSAKNQQPITDAA
jgi:hypothetical protein